MSKKLLAGLAIGLLVFGMVGVASATTLTFDGLAGTDMIGGINTGQYTEFRRNIDTSSVNDYSFSAMYNHLYVGPAYTGGDSNSLTYNDTDFIMATGALTVNRTDGGVFNLNSIDLGNWYDSNAFIDYRADRTFLIYGELFGGGFVAQTLTLDKVLNSNDRDGSDFERFILLGFTDIMNFSIIDRQYEGSFAVDNIDVSSPVPEPATLFLFGSGLAGIVGSRFRRKKVA